jgi:hypothetical protein
MATIAETEFFRQYLIVLSDGTQITMDKATNKQIASAISIRKITEDGESPIKNP